MIRLAENTDWWTRRVGGWTILCFEATVQVGAMTGPRRIVHETIIGKPHLGIVGKP
jgi:hypothetical protein